VVPARPAHHATRGRYRPALRLDRRSRRPPYAPITGVRLQGGDSSDPFFRWKADNILFGSLAWIERMHGIDHPYGL
jgi:hypothetical protein